MNKKGPNPIVTLNYFIKICKEENVETILDIGAGAQQHSNILKKEGFNVKTNDILPSDYQGKYTELGNIGKFDAIWCSHVLEHQLNVGLFLDKINNDLKEGGILAITVPPRKDRIVGGHVTLWNAGLLLYNLILAGFNCSKASIATYYYNVSVILKKERIQLPELSYDEGDIEKLRQYFPKNIQIKEAFNGNIIRHNWDETAPEFEPPIFPLDMR